MVKRKNDDEPAVAEAPETETAETPEVVEDPQRPTDEQGVRRGLGAPPPGTDGDPTVKPV